MYQTPMQSIDFRKGAGLTPPGVSPSTTPPRSDDDLGGRSNGERMTENDVEVRHSGER